MNPEIQSLQTEADNFYCSLSSLTIHNDKDLALAAEQLVRLKAFLSRIEESRTRLVKPLNDHVKYINSEFHKITDKPKKLEALIRQIMMDYRKEQNAKLTEEQKKIEQALADSPFALSLAKESKLTQPKTIEGVTFKTTWQFEIVDPKLVPDKYKVIDETLVREAIRNGERQIPGIRIYSEERPAITP